MSKVVEDSKNWQPMALGPKIFDVPTSSHDQCVHRDICRDLLENFHDLEINVVVEIKWTIYSTAID